MPYRIDVHDATDEALDRLVELGALDVQAVPGGIAAIVPDTVPVETLARLFGVHAHVKAARGRDDGSIWVVAPRPLRIGRVQILPAECAPQPRAIRLIDGAAFGTGLHPSTRLCLEALDHEVDAACPSGMLDVGTGSGILALAALASGVGTAVALDLDEQAVRVAADNARLNGLAARLRLVQGGPEAVSGAWPLVVANVLAAPLMDLAPMLVRRVSHGGRLILSGIRASLAAEVEGSYRRVGMRPMRVDTCDGWTALILAASW